MRRIGVALVVVGGCATTSFGDVAFSVDATAGRAAISPLIYGINPASTGYGMANPGLGQASYSNLNLASERLGGNRWTAYNWQTNASNAGSDYIYSNDTYLGGGTTPIGAIRPMLVNAAAVGASPVVTVPMAGYVAADKAGQTPTGSPATNGRFAPSFASAADGTATGAVYQSGLVSAVAAAYPATASRPLVFTLDNEPDLWSSTHPEVHPAAVTYAELESKSVTYAKVIKATAPNALVVGPASYGWNGYTTLQNASDSAANGDFVNHYLRAMSAASASAGVRLLDSLDLHWYPEAQGTNGVRITGTDTAAATVTARVQAPRSLWDPTYTEKSWITQSGSSGGPIQLIPRMQSKIAGNYAGTKLSFGEYNFGAGNSISGGLAQADVLGVFGKYGVFSAQQWPLAADESYVLGAMRMFRNYDGKNGAFGDTAVAATNTDVAGASVYASVDATNPAHLILVLINKGGTATTAAVNLANAGRPEVAAAYQLTDAAAVPVSVGTVAIGNPAGFSYAMPAYSVTTLTMTSNQWMPSVGGSWGAAGSWTAAVPEGVGAHANFLAKPTGLTASGTVTLDGNRTVGRVVFDDAASYTIAAGTGGMLMIDDGPAAGPAITVISGQHTIAAPIALVAGATVTTPAGGPVNSLRLTGGVSGAGTLTVAAGSQLVLSCSVDPGLTAAGTVRFTGNVTSAAVPMVRTVGALSVPAGGIVYTTGGVGRTVLAAAAVSVAGKFDLVSNALVVADGDVAGVTAAVGRAFAGGTWAGASGITSSTAAADGSHLAAVGVMLNGGAYATFFGRAVSSTDVLARLTMYGDANLDGRVDLADYTRVDAGFLTRSTGWAVGDFNYDGVVDASDYTLIDNAFNRGVDAGVPAAIVARATRQVAAVPEPAGVVVAVVIGMGWRRRRLTV